MPTASNRGVSLFYEVDGASEHVDDGSRGGEIGGAPVAFVGDAGFGAWQWSVLQPAIVGPRRTVVWDLRGTGRSDVPDGPYEVDQLAADLEAVLADAGIDRGHLVGAGLGGMVVLRYARTYGRARSLAVFGAAASGDAVDVDALGALHPAERSPDTVRESLAGAFSPGFLTGHESFVEQVVEWRLAEDATPAAVDAQLAALLGFEAGPRYDLTLPALVGYGVDDPVVPPAASESLAADLPRGEAVELAGRHLAYVEAGDALADRLVAFLEDVETGERAQ